MATYVLLTTLTPEGRQTLHKNPDRFIVLLEANKEVEQFGCKVIAHYAVLGSYDFVSVIEAPDNETAAHLSVDLGSRGTGNMITMPAMQVDAFLAKLKGRSWSFFFRSPARLGLYVRKRDRRFCKTSFRRTAGCGFCPMAISPASGMA